MTDDIEGGSLETATRLLVGSIVYQNPLFAALGWPDEPYYWGA